MCVCVCVSVNSFIRMDKLPLTQWPMHKKPFYHIPIHTPCHNNTKSEFLDIKDPCANFNIYALDAHDGPTICYNRTLDNRYIMIVHETIPRFFMNTHRRRCAHAFYNIMCTRSIPQYGIIRSRLIYIEIIYLLRVIYLCILNYCECILCIHRQH